MEISFEKTPNPQSLKFLISKKISEKSLQIKSQEEAKKSPLAQKILGFPWAKSVFLGENFVTVSKEDWVDWEVLKEPLMELIKEHLIHGGEVLLPEKKDLRDQSKGEDSKEVQKIKEILEKEIQPAVAMDGGFIEFVSYKDGIVYLSLQGACSGCPASSVTLKQGIETRLRQFLPEIKDIREV